MTQRESLSQDEISARLLSFIRERLLSGDPQNELEEDTPLLAYGVLNSLNTAVLISYIRDELNILIPLSEVNAAHFSTVATISSMLRDITTEQNP